MGSSPAAPTGRRSSDARRSAERGTSAIDHDPEVELRSDDSVTILSCADVVDLRDVAARRVLADEQQWATAGGPMLDCVPFEAGCASRTSGKAYLRHPGDDEAG